MKRWKLGIVIDEQEDEGGTYAKARLHTGDDTHRHGRGTAKRAPGDGAVPEIGPELAGATALSDLAPRLLDAAAGDIEHFAHSPAHPYLQPRRREGT